MQHWDQINVSVVWTSHPLSAFLTYPLRLNPIFQLHELPMTEWMHHYCWTSQFTCFFFQILGTETICPQVCFPPPMWSISIASSSFAFTCKFTHVLNQNEGGAFTSSWATPTPYKLQGEDPASLFPCLPHGSIQPLNQLGYSKSSFPSRINLLKWQKNWPCG